MTTTTTTTTTPAQPTPLPLDATNGRTTQDQAIRERIGYVPTPSLATAPVLATVEVDAVGMTAGSFAATVAHEYDTRRIDAVGCDASLPPRLRNEVLAAVRMLAGAVYEDLDLGDYDRIFIRNNGLAVLAIIVRGVARGRSVVFDYGGFVLPDDRRRHAPSAMCFEAAPALHAPMPSVPGSLAQAKAVGAQEHGPAALADKTGAVTDHPRDRVWSRRLAVCLAAAPAVVVAAAFVVAAWPPRERQACGLFSLTPS
jgi:hypothetical protein